MISYELADRLGEQMFTASAGDKIPTVVNSAPRKVYIYRGLVLEQNSPEGFISLRGPDEIIGLESLWCPEKAYEHEPGPEPELIALTDVEGIMLPEQSVMAGKDTDNLILLAERVRVLTAQLAVKTLNTEEQILFWLDQAATMAEKCQMFNTDRARIWRAAPLSVKDLAALMTVNYEVARRAVKELINEDRVTKVNDLYMLPNKH